jgi:hypothetical protein
MSRSSTAPPVRVRTWIDPPATVPSTIVSAPDSFDSLRNASGFPSGVSSVVSLLASAIAVPARSSERSSVCDVTTAGAKHARRLERADLAAVEQHREPLILGRRGARGERDQCEEDRDEAGHERIRSGERAHCA